MLSRVANSIYWINRYIERAENYARFIDVNQMLIMDLPPMLDEQWKPLIETTGAQIEFEKLFGENYSRNNVLKFLVFEPKNPNSILSCLTSARENARTVREIISSEMWIQINELYLNVKHGIHNEKWDEDNLQEMLTSIKMGGHTFNGIMDSTFSHGEGWHMGIMGRYLERAEKTARILDMKYYYLLPKIQDVNTPLDMLQWSALLKSASAFEMYRKIYGKLSTKNIIAFLALDQIFPRSMHFCLIAAENSLHQITGNTLSSFTTLAEKTLGKFRSDLDYTDVQDILDRGLHQYLDDFQQKHNMVGESIYQTFFHIN